MIKTTDIELWEIMKDGKNDEVYEVTDCYLTSYIGEKVKVSEKYEYGRHFKCLVNPDVKGNDEESLAKLYGCIGTAKFKRVGAFEEITLTEAVMRMDDYRMVYILKAGDIVPFDRYDDLSDFYITDMSDLMGKTFYRKEGE